jgi:hypothetical protein
MKAAAVTSKIRAGLPSTLERTNIVRIVNVAWQSYFARVAPELQETKDTVQSIGEIYARQAR